MISLLRSIVLCSLLTAMAATAQADLRLPNVFGNHMVLQRDMPLRVWGWADAGTEVFVVVAGQTQSTAAGDDGRWQLMLDPLPAGDRTSSSSRETAAFSSTTFSSARCGSAQGNRTWNGPSPPATVLIWKSSARITHRSGCSRSRCPASNNHSKISMAHGSCARPERRGNSRPSAITLAAGCNKTLGVPVGLIDNAWGGSAAEAWTPREKLAEDELFERHLAFWKAEAEKADEAAIRAEFAKRHEQWKQRMQDAVAKGQPIPGYPKPRHPLLGNQRHGNLFNGRVAPIAGYGIRGVIWYQGESNAGRAFQYRTLFPLMISSWRDRWGQGDFPFYWVQLADFRGEVDQPGESDWAELREAQTMTLDKLDNVGEAVIIDLGEGKDIHPRNKRTVADRLARHALANQYGVTVKSQSPRFESAEFVDGKAIITLANADGLRTFDVGLVRGFAVAG